LWLEAATGEPTEHVLSLPLDQIQETVDVELLAHVEHDEEVEGEKDNDDADGRPFTPHVLDDAAAFNQFLRDRGVAQDARDCGRPVVGFFIVEDSETADDHSEGQEELHDCEVECLQSVER